MTGLVEGGIILAGGIPAPPPPPPAPGSSGAADALAITATATATASSSASPGSSPAADSLTITATATATASGSAPITGKQLVGMFNVTSTATVSLNMATTTGPNALLKSVSYPLPSATGTSVGPLTNIPVPSRGFYQLNGTAEVTDIQSHWPSGSSTTYTFSNAASNTGGTVPAGGMTIDGYTVPAGTKVFQFMNFAETFDFLSGAPSVLFRGCRLRGPAVAPGFFGSETGGYNADLLIHYCDLGGNAAPAGKCAEVAIDVEQGANLRCLRNYISYISTGIQPNMGTHCDVVENYIEKLTLANAGWHLNGISFNGGSPNFLVLRNHIVTANTDDLGNAIVQTDCISMFQDFGTFPGGGTNSDGSHGYQIAGNYVGGTGYCFYLGQNAGTPASSVQHLSFTNNLVTTASYATGGFFGPVNAIPTFSPTYSNTQSGNLWDDGASAGTSFI